ncbi:MAG TPA: phosphoribosylamine--glycine ligase [Firmicutes bacterium]|nr:phosphoribosylamine--glycine ligase [Bacillota bacterium]
MRVLIVGGGGREHALAWKLSQSPLLEELYCVPGNAGISSVARCVSLDPYDREGLKKWALEKGIDLTVIGPEGPLVGGLADYFRKSGIKVFGPGKKAARLEGSKVWAKNFMVNNGIPTASFAVFDQLDQARRYLDQRPEGPLVVKADGLAAGKGVTVAHNLDQAEQVLTLIMGEQVFGEAGRRVIFEEQLVGEEVSVLAITDGRELIILPSAQDHKALGEGDTGPNTGGMGAYSPAPVLTPELARQVEQLVLQPVLSGMQALGLDYRGVIYAGLMIAGHKINVLEFNVRFGDPETQVILPLLKSDLLPWLLSAAEGRLSPSQPQWADQYAVCVVLASGGYPGQYQTGASISGLEALELTGDQGLAVFHAGTALHNGSLITSGGRVLGVTAWDIGMEDAVAKVYRAVDRIKFKDCYYRRDIAHRAINRRS